jgi:hypothetical protein
MELIDEQGLNFDQWRELVFKLKLKPRREKTHETKGIKRGN